MKTYLYILCLLLFFTSQAQVDKRETAYILFELSNPENCRVENGAGKFVSLKKYRKEVEEKRIAFYICDEEFGFANNKVVDTLNSLKDLDIKNIEYLKKKYYNSKEFKHHVFKKVFLLERISKNKILKYDVYWCCEWSID